MPRLVRTTRRNLKPLGPIGTLGGVCTASMVTGIGIVTGLEPYTILIRASISAFLVGGVLAFGLAVIQLANLPPANRTQP